MAGCSGRNLDDDEVIPVNAKALYQILVALKGPPHYIRELQVTASLQDSPITKLVDEYNSWAMSEAARKEST